MTSDDFSLGIASDTLLQNKSQHDLKTKRTTVRIEREMLVENGRKPGLLPADVLLKIFSYCSYRDLVQFQFVCRWWQQVSRYRHLWRNIVYKPDYVETTKHVIENMRVSPELRALHLENVECRNVTKELVIEIVNACPRLEQLSVCWNCLYEKFHFKMEKIKILILSRKEQRTTLASQVFFEHLENCFPNVEHLDCSDFVFEARVFCAYLRKKGQSFHTLGFRSEMNCSEECILQYLSMCPNLKSLTLLLKRSVWPVTRHLPVESFEHFKQISSLTVQTLGFTSSDDYLPMFKSFPNLVALELHQGYQGEEQELPAIAKNCPLLEKLTLSSQQFSDNQLKFISNFKNLTFLCLKSNHHITDAGVVDLQAILELRYLDISDCCKITPQCLFTVCSFPKLQTLKFDLQNCDPPAGLGASHVKNPDLHIMFYNCKNTSVLDRLWRQQLRISLLKSFPSYCCVCVDEVLGIGWLEDSDWLLEDREIIV